jgi:hypothetical protein
MEQKCPSSDLAPRANDVFEVPCPKCHADVELFADDRQGTCPACGHKFPNPRLAEPER